MLIGLQTRRYCEQILVRTDPCKNKDMLIRVEQLTLHDSLSYIFFDVQLKV